MEHPERPSDAEVINSGIAEASEFGQAVSETIARRIASQLHGGQSSALYSLSSAGHLDYDRLTAELAQNRREFAENPEVSGWLDALDGYVRSQLESEPKVFCSPLASYNEGRLEGEWLPATDVERLWRGVGRVMLAPSVPGEEFFWTDTDGFEGYRLSEFETVANTVRIARLIREHGEAAAVWLGMEDQLEAGDLAEAFSEAYIGEFDSERDMAEHLFEEWCIGQDWPEMAVTYFDMEKWARDLDYGGDIYTVERGGRVYAFRNV